MPRETYHPKAYLSKVKNINRGLKARTIMLNALERQASDANTMAKQTGLHYRVALHHLKLLETEGIAARKGGRPQVWQLTGIGQKTLAN